MPLPMMKSLFSTWLDIALLAQAGADTLPIAWSSALLVAVGLTVGAFATSLLLGWIRTRFFPSPRLKPDPEGGLSAVRLLLSETARLSLWPLRFAVWVGWLYAVSGLFSTELQSQIYRVLIGPLPAIALSVLLGAIAVQVGYRLIDLLFEAVRDGRFLASSHSPRLELRIDTFNGVFKGTLTVFVVILVGLLVLSKSGLDVGPLLAGAGILGLAISFGAQSLIKDVITGFFILFEDQYGVGDMVVVNNNESLSGLVENLNLRITQLRNSEGRLITIPNSEIKTVANLSSRWAQVDMKVPVQHTVDVDRAMAVMSEEVEALRADPDWEHRILEAPRVLGVDAFTDMGVILRLQVKTAPLQQWSVDRAIRRRLKLAFAREGILLVGQLPPVQIESNGKPT